MAKDSGKREQRGGRIVGLANRSIDSDVDELFKRPLAEFTGARNALATRLKREGRANEANLVKALAKPSVTAWAVNQLYWKHRASFDQLFEAGERVRQASSNAKKLSDLRSALDARVEALKNLSDLAAELLSNADHSPTPDTLHRITTTLEALSSPSHANGTTLGRLTRDVDPPGFESLASMLGNSVLPRVNEKPTRISASQKAAGKKESASSDVDKKRRQEEMRRARIAAAKISLQQAKKLLAEARAREERLDSVQRKAYAEAKQAETELREAELRLKKAKAASDEAEQRAKKVTAETKEAAKALEDAKRNVDKAAKELESLFRES
jgi:hypothetical protein